MIKKFCVDRVEEQFAVCIDDSGDILNIPCENVPSDIKEGDILVFKDGAYHIDTEETVHRREEVRNLLDELFQ